VFNTTQYRTKLIVSKWGYEIVVQVHYNITERGEEEILERAASLQGELATTQGCERMEATALCDMRIW
jgi:hypothetical protein